MTHHPDYNCWGALKGQYSQSIALLLTIFYFIYVVLEVGILWLFAL